MHREIQPLLLVEDLITGYGKRQILDGVTLSVSDGEIVAMIGHNGAGKSTFMKAVFGMLPIWSGAVTFDGAQLSLPLPSRLLSDGVVYVPQGNRVFSDLTVGENLEMNRVTVSDRAKLRQGVERALSMFPELTLRVQQRAGTLSGGEKQMLALANALVLSPRLVLLDEPSLGLAPPLVTAALQRIQQISSDSGAAVLIIEQKVREVLRIARRVYVLRNGVVSYSGATESLADEAKLRDVYL